MKIKKYIIIEGQPVLFPVEFLHADMVDKGTTIDSAGTFILIRDDKDQNIKVKCMGESTSLSVKSHPSTDEILIANYLGLNPEQPATKVIPAIKAHLNSDKECLSAFALAMSRVYKELIHARNNRITLPPSVGKGYMSLSELSVGLALFKAEVKFNNRVNFLRSVVPSNAHLYMHFNMSEIPFFIKQDNGKQLNVGDNWIEEMFYSSSGKSVELEVPAGNWAKWITIIIHRSWLINKQLNYKVDIGSGLIHDFLKNRTMQGIISLPMEIMVLTFELLQEKDEQTYMRLQTKGKVLKLLSYF